MDRRKTVGVLLILLMLAYEFNQALFTIASTTNKAGTFETAESSSEAEFLKKQLENGIPPEGPLEERSYVIPAGMNTSLADRLWLSIAPLISLGHNEGGVVSALSELNLPRKLEAGGETILVDYANLHITRNPEEGKVIAEIPIISNSSLSSVQYDVKGVKKLVKLYNATFIRYYNVSVKVSKLCNVTYIDLANVTLKAGISLSGDLRDNLIRVYLPVKSPALLQELCINLLADGFTLGLRVLEYKVWRVRISGRDVDCYWIHIERVVKATRDLRGVMLSIGYSGGWITEPSVIMPWPVLKKGEYVSDHWIKWAEGEELTVEIQVDGFRNSFILGFDEAADAEQNVLSRVLSEDELKALLKQPFYEELNLSKAPKNWRIEPAGEKVFNETIWVTNSEYERLRRLGWRKGNSFFIDSGEAEWEYTVTNRTLGPCKSIKLFYSPLKANKGELVHGVTLRNYADSDLNYTLRLKTATNIFLFFSRVDEDNGSITVSRESTVPILLIQQEPAVGDATLELVKDGRVIASVKVYLALKATTYWKGFWDGLSTKLPGILITSGIMVAMSFLIPHAYVRPVYYLLLGVGVLSNLIEIASDVAEANKAGEEMLSLAEALENRSREFLANGSVEHAEECRSLASALRQEALTSPILNVLSSLTIGVSWDEIRVALGLKEPPARNELERQYAIGYARGRVTGAAVSCILYVALYTMVYRVKAERIGQRLTATQILETVARGVYNWITPAIWDAAILAIQGKTPTLFNKIADLLLGNKYSRKFGEAVGSLLEKTRAAFDPPKADEALETTSELSKHVLENVPSRESSGKILDAISIIIEQYSPEELEEKGGAIVRSIVSIWIKDGDEAIESLNNWLSINAKDQAKIDVLDEVLMAISGDAVKGVGLKIGCIVDSYLDIKGKYGENIAEAFLNAMLKNPNQLEEVLAKLSSFEFKEPHRVTLRRGGPRLLNLGESNKVKPGTYVVRVYWEYGEKNGVAEFSIVKDVELDQINIPEDEVERVLDQISRDEAEVLIAKVELFDYRLFFPTEFIVGDVKLRLGLFNNEMEIGGNLYGFKSSTDVGGGKICVNAELNGKNTEGNRLMLAFYSDTHGNAKKVEIKIGRNPHYVVGIDIDETMDLMTIKWKDTGGEVVPSEYSFNLKPLSEQIGKHPYEFPLKEGQKHTKLKERLFRLLGYDALKELEGGIGSKYSIIVEYDNGKKAYCGAKELGVNIPEGVSKIEWIKIVSIEDEVTRLLHEIIEMRAGGSLGERELGEMNYKVGKASEYIVIEGYGKINYQEDILKAFSEKSGIPLDVLEGRVKFIRRGGGGEVDGILSTLEDIVVDGEVVFKKDDVIAIIEMKSTVTGKSFEELLSGAIEDLKKHLQLPDYKNVKYGVAIGFSYDPVQVLAEEPGMPPLIKVYTGEELIVK